jgi:hypothetical protein
MPSPQKRSETRGHLTNGAGRPPKPAGGNPASNTAVHHGKRNANPNVMPWQSLSDGDISKPPDWCLKKSQDLQDAMYRSNTSIEFPLSYLEHHELRRCRSNRSSALGAQERARSEAPLFKPTLASLEGV